MNTLLRPLSPDAAELAPLPAAVLTECELLCQAGAFTMPWPGGPLQLSSGLRTLIGQPELPPQTLDEISWIPPAERRLVAHIWRQTTPGQRFEIQHRVQLPDGQLRRVVHRGLLMAGDTPEAPPTAYGVLHDITELKAAQQRADDLAQAHETTGLPNRSWLLRKIDHAVATAGGDGRGFSVLSIAVPRIAELAGSMGFVAADALATALATRLQSLHTANEWLAQLGSGEFGFVIRHGARRDPDDTLARARELQHALQAPLQLDGLDIVPSCRIGVSVYPGHGDNAAQLLQAAQSARSDGQSEQDVAFHTPQSTARALHEIHIEARLRQALAGQEFQLAYQPLVCLKTGAIIGVEALLRWQDATGETYAPDEFLPVAERSGLVAPLGDWVIREACAQVVRWREAGLPPVRMAINLSPVQFQIGDVETSLRQAMAATGARASELCLEVTESALLHDAARVGATLRKLKEQGMEIALDDFGTGYSSLGRLRSLPIDVLKIDRDFVKDITADADSAAIIRAIIHLAHSLRIQVLAEGIESEGQLAMVLSSGCDQLQGFFFSPPVSEREITDMLQARKQLPAQYTLNHAQSRTLLLVDDEENILSALKRLFRRDGYRIFTANSGAQALELLRTTEVDVIVSDQRMPGMAGVDFLRKAKELWPDTIRMTLSGFTDLQSIIDAVNEGAVFKFLTKPWDDARLREHVALAFKQKEMANENRRLAQQLVRAGADQADLNRRLETLLQRQQVDAELAEASAGGVRDLLALMPAAVLGLDPDGLLAYANQEACRLFPQVMAELGNRPGDEVQALIGTLKAGPAVPEGTLLTLPQGRYRGWMRRLDEGSGYRGDMLVVMPCCQGGSA